MAPRTRNSDKRNTKHRKKDVRFRRELPVRKSATVIHPPENYENLILYYLTKLKRLFAAPDHPHPGARENSADRLRREHVEDKKNSEANSKVEIDPNKYTSRHSTPRPREQVDIADEIKEKVYNVVNAAIEYGFANNVLEKKGDCFIFRNKRNSKIANRQLTPGPCAAVKTYCSQCNCDNCKNMHKNHNANGEMNGYYPRYGNARPVTEHSPSRQQYLGRRPTTSVNNSQSVHESKTQHSISRGTNKVSLHGKSRSSRSKSCIVTSNNLKDRVRKVCTCSKCRAIDQRKKAQRK